MRKLSHINNKNQAQMVDVTVKATKPAAEAKAHAG